ARLPRSSASVTPRPVRSPLPRGRRSRRGPHQRAAAAHTGDAAARCPHATKTEFAASRMAALAEGDVEAVVRLLHPDVTFRGDSNRRAPTAFRVIRGPDRVARFLFGLARRYGPEWLSSNQLALVNGQLGSYTTGSASSEGHPGVMPRVTAMTRRRGQVCALC